MVKRKTGVRPPANAAWQMGKSAASILFVQDSERYLETCTDTASADRLRQAIDEVKQGKCVIDDWTTPEEFLAS